MKTNKRLSSIRPLACSVAVALATGLVLNAAEPNPGDTKAQTGSPIPLEISQEIAEIQRQLGGSIVRGPRNFPIPPKSLDSQKIETLRNAAAQLDITASSLEWAELYHWADQLRSRAQEFRLEARKLRSLQGQAGVSLPVAPPISRRIDSDNGHEQSKKNLSTRR